MKKMHGGRLLPAAALFLAFCMLLTSCTAPAVPAVLQKNAESSGAGGQPSDSGIGYTVQQMLIPVFSQKKHLQDVYTDQIWDTTVDSEGTLYRDIFAVEMKEFFVEMSLLNRMAAEKKVTLSSAERKKLSTAAENFYRDSVQKCDALKSMQQDETVKVFEAYATAEKMKEELITESKVEVSDSEAKVIEIQQIVLKDSATANEVLTEAKKEGTDFYALAQNYTTSGNIQLKAGRDDLKKPVADAAFALDNNELSGVIQADGQFYVLKCINSYDKTETGLRKTELEKKRLKDTVRKVYEEYAGSHPVAMDTALWNRVIARSAEPYDGGDFFEAYREATENGGV